jgi:hypothetical protein
MRLQATNRNSVLTKLTRQSKNNQEQACAGAL